MGAGPKKAAKDRCREAATNVNVFKSPKPQALSPRHPQSLRGSLLGNAGRMLVLAAGGYIVTRIVLGLLHLG
jgi:hypothetical protein